MTGIAPGFMIGEFGADIDSAPETFPCPIIQMSIRGISCSPR